MRNTNNDSTLTNWNEIPICVYSVYYNIVVVVVDVVAGVVIFLTPTISFSAQPT